MPNWSSILAILRRENLENVEGTVLVRIEMAPKGFHRDPSKHLSKVGAAHGTPASTPRSRYPPVTYSASNLRRTSEMSLALFWA